MSYQDDEASVSNAKPVELYRFIGTYANYYYTSGVELVTYGGQDYQPIALKRSAIVVGTQDDDNTDITIQMKATNQIVLDYGFETSPPKLDLTIFRYHDISDVKQLWFGSVTNIQVDDGIATLRSPSLLSSLLTANAPNVYYQSPCNNTLFDARCKVVEATFTHAATVTAVAGKTITIDGLGTLDGKLIGGELRLASGERRMIVGQAGLVLTVNFPFALLISGTSCSIVAGCDHLWAGDCKLKFDNRINFGGFVFIPPVNPFSGGINPSSNPIADTTCLPVAFSGWWLKVRIDFWGQSLPHGPINFPNHGIGYAPDPASPTASGADETLYVGNPATPTPDYWIDDSGAHTVQAIEYTFLQAHYPTDFTNVVRSYRVDMQFPADSIDGPTDETGATFSYKKWNMGDYAFASCINNPEFTLSSLFPRWYDFRF